MSQILRTAPAPRLASLFSLFPVKTLRQRWDDLRGKKEEMSSDIAGNRNVQTFSAFITDNINLCKQHIYAFSSDITAADFADITFTGLDSVTPPPEKTDLSKRTFLFEITIEVAIWSDPPERQFLHYVVPLQIRLYEGYILVRFVKFERHVVVPEVNEENFTIRSHEHEEPTLAHIRRDILDAGFTCARADLHRGAKRLWAIDYMDASRLAYQTPDSTNTKIMHDKRGIKQYNRDEYDVIIQNATFGPCLFSTIVAEGEESVDLTVNMTKGSIAFGKYAEREEARDDILEQILRNN